MAGHTVLLTGATGFLGKVVLEALLRNRDELAIERVLVLIRAGSPEAVHNRFAAEVLGSECLSQLPGQALSCVAPIRGDVVREGLGLNADDSGRLCAETTQLIHCAASVEFDLSLAEASRINITGSLNALALARRCPRLMSFVSVSTAYVTLPSGGRDPIPEVLAPLPRPAEALYEEIERGGTEREALLRETGHPNTYTLTKSVAEHLLVAGRGQLPLAIVRPSIISACRHHPFPGWIDSQAAFAGFITMLGAGQLRAIAARPDARVDVIPCDDVAERILDAAFRDPPTRVAPRILHATAGREHCCSVALCRDRVERFFGRNPVGSGPRLRHLGPDGVRFRLAEWLHHRLALGVAGRWQRLRGRGLRARALERTRERLLELNRAFPYFTHHSFDFRSSAPLDADFEPAAYLDVVCAGIHRHLMRGGRARESRGRQRRAPTSRSSGIPEPRDDPASPARSVRRPST